MKHEECLTCCQFNEKRCHCTHTLTGPTTQPDGNIREKTNKLTVYPTREITNRQRSTSSLSRLRNVRNSLNGYPVLNVLCVMFSFSFILIFVCAFLRINYSAHQHFSAHLFLNKIIHCCSFDCIEQLPGNVERGTKVEWGVEM
jgi:hypothetical protein